MPNWCSNSLLITTNTEVDRENAERQIEMFKDRAKPSEAEEDINFCMQGLYPMPKELEGTKGLSDKPNWYNWRLEHWGTKWDVSGYLEYSDRDMLEYSFDSAWSPPSSFIEKVSKDFPLLRLRLKYDEPGMCFMGRAIAINGHLDDVSIEY